MSETRKDDPGERGPAIPGRRKFLVAGAGVAAASFLNRIPSVAHAQALGTTGTGSPQQHLRPGRRKLGALEVSLPLPRSVFRLEHVCHSRPDDGRSRQEVAAIEASASFSVRSRCLPVRSHE